MTTIEKPTTPTPATMAEINPSLNQGDLPAEPVETEVDTFDRPVLGKVAMTREEYSTEQTEPVERVVDPAKFDRAAKTAIRAAEDEEVRNELFVGFTVHDSTQPDTVMDEDHDELPEDLKDDLGEPDDDESNAA